MAVVSLPSARMAGAQCTLAGWRPACIPAVSRRCGAMPARATRSSNGNGWGEEAPGTGLRHFPEQTAGSSSDDDRQRGFDMRSTAEVYEMFEKLQQRRGGKQGGGGGVERRDADGGQAPEEAGEVQRSGPQSGRRRRPGVVSSLDPEESSTSGFDMRSTAEVYQMWDKMLNGQVKAEPVEPQSDGDCPAG